MPNNKEGIPQPSIVSSPKYRENWDDIFRKGKYCFNCGTKFSQQILKDHPECYIFHPDGEVECVSCNFN